MGVATSSVVNPTRSKALMVRLAPYLVEAICELTRALKDKTHAQTEISGLLFGKSEDGVLTVEALKTFKDSSGPRSDLARRERMEKAFTAAMSLANEDPEFAAYKLLGWFSLRGGGGLINSDTEFHNRHFKNAEEIALIVWREGDTQITTELYAAADGGKLSTEDYRWSSVRLSTELRHVSQPLDLVMRVRMNDDLYLRTYSVPDGRDRKEEWKRIAENAKRTILSLLPGRDRSDVEYPEDLPLPPPSEKAKRSFESHTLFRGSDPEAAPPLPPVTPAKAAPAKPAAAPAKPAAAPPKPAPPPATAPKRTPQPPAEAAKETATAAAPYDVNRAPRPKAVPEVSGLPMVIPRHKPALKDTPWLSMALVFVVFSGLTFAFLALKSTDNSDGKLSQVMRVLFPGSDLELRAASHGDSLWITWNRRNPAVAASSGAVLGVSDGARHFERKLDPSQVADGEVRYTPVSGDVLFELKVYGTDQSVALGRLRVVDAATPVASDSKQPLDLSNPASSESSAAKNTLSSPAPTQTNSPNAEPAVEATNKGNTPALNPPLPTPVSKPAAKPAIETPKPTQQIVQHLPAQKSPAPQHRQPIQTLAVEQHPPLVVTQSVVSNSKPAPPAHITTNNNAPPLTSNTAIAGWDANPPENKPAAQQAPQQAAPPDSKTVDFIGPRVLLQVMPSTRNLTPGLIVEATRVEVEVRVDTSGHVKAAHLTNPNVKSQLGSAAVAAAKQWTFQPATLRGQHVDSDHTIVFEFRPEGQ